MAKEEIKSYPEVAEKEVKNPEIITHKEYKEYKVKKEFTLDKLYKPGSTVLLEEGKIKETLISNKFI